MRSVPPVSNLILSSSELSSTCIFVSESASTNKVALLVIAATADTTSIDTPFAGAVEKVSVVPLTE